MTKGSTRPSTTEHRGARKKVIGAVTTMAVSLGLVVLGSGDAQAQNYCSPYRWKHEKFARVVNGTGNYRYDLCQSLQARIKIYYYGADRYEWLYSDQQYEKTQVNRPHISVPIVKWQWRAKPDTGKPWSPWADIENWVNG